MSLLIAIFILIVALLLGIPVPFSIFLTSIYMLFVFGYDPSFLIPYGLGELKTSVLLAIPLFILAGGFIQEGGMSDGIIDFIERLLGKVHGALGMVTVVSSAAFGAISGSGAATMTTIGTILIPRLNKAGYPKGFSASVLASASVLGMLIPPSSLMILYAWVSDTSVLAAFLSTIIPGFVLIVFLNLINFFYMKKYATDFPESSYTVDSPESSNIVKEDHTDSISLFKSFTRSLPTIILAIIVLGGIYGGYMTTTEAASVAVFYALFVGIVVYRTLKIKNTIDVIIKAARMTGVIMLMLFGSMILSRMLVMENLPGILLDLLNLVSDNKFVVLIFINLILVVFGMLMDDISGVLISTPILLPIVMAIGVDPIHFAAIMSVNMGLGTITPPSAGLLFLAGRMAGTSIKTMVFPSTLILIFAWIPTLLITTYFPEISLFLPRLILGY